MEVNMKDEQFDALLKLILQIVKDSKNREEAEEKIKKLIEEIKQ